MNQSCSWAQLEQDFSQSYLTQPNVIFSIIAMLASHQINLLEIVSTYTELTMILEKKELERTIQILGHFFRKKKRDKK